MTLTDLINWVLLPVIAFLLYKVYDKIEKVESNTTQLLINDGKQDMRIEELDKRTVKLEKKVAI